MAWAGCRVNSTAQPNWNTPRRPNLDCLAVEGNLGLSQPAGTGVTPGSGPGHLVFVRLTIRLNM